MRVFDTAEWIELDRFDTGAAVALALSPDGRRLAVGTGSGEVLVLDPSSGIVEQSVKFPGIDFPVDVVFLDDDHLLAATAGPTPLVVLTLNAQELIDLARNGATRTFTEAECFTYDIEDCPAAD